jgi:hypothetical protein
MDNLMADMCLYATREDAPEVETDDDDAWLNARGGY